jgi:hypothetical protein
VILFTLQLYYLQSKSLSVSTAYEAVFTTETACTLLKQEICASTRYLIHCLTAHCLVTFDCTIPFIKMTRVQFTEYEFANGTLFWVYGPPSCPKISAVGRIMTYEFCAGNDVDRWLLRCVAGFPSAVWLACFLTHRRAGLSLCAAPHGQWCSSNFMNVVRSGTNELGCNSVTVIHLFSIRLDVVEEFVVSVLANKGRAVEI